MKSITVIGLGYVGLNLALNFSRAGHQVLGYDIDSAHVDRVNCPTESLRDLSLYELQELRSLGFRASSEFDDAIASEVLIVCLPTPIDERGKPDTRALDELLGRVAGKLAGKLLVIESTVQVGFTRRYFEKLVAIEPAAASELDIAFSPERVNPGDKTSSVAPKLLGGLSSRSMDRAKELYKTVFKSLVTVSSVEVAEAAKLLENSYRFINIAFINSLSTALNQIGVDPVEVISAASTKPFGFEAFYPSAGIGGHCIPVDYAYLIDSFDSDGVRAPLALEVAAKSELERKLRLEGIVRAELEAAKLTSSGNVALLIIGLGYKPGIPDVRNSPGWELAMKLSSEYQVWAYDPAFGPGKFGPVNVLEFTEGHPNKNYCYVTAILQDLSSTLPDRVLEDSFAVVDCLSQSHKSISPRYRRL